MKAIYKSITALFFLIPLMAAAQKNFEVNERVATLSIGDRTGYSVVIEDMSEKEVAKALKEWLGEKQKKPAIEETGKHEIMVDDIVLTPFGEVPVDLYFLFEESNDKVLLTGFFNVNGAFVSATANPGNYKDAMEFMKKIALRTEKIKIAEQLADAEKELEKKQNEKKDLEKKEEQLNQTISDCEATIQKSKGDLQQNATDQETKASEITSQQSTVDKIESELKKYEGN
jgi:hypothetical protein